MNRDDKGENDQMTNVTDYRSMWALHCDRGRQQWQLNSDTSLSDIDLELLSKQFAYDKASNPNSSDLIYRGSRSRVTRAEVPYEVDVSSPVAKSRIQGIGFYSTLQMDDGHWPGDYGGPLFLLPGLIFVSHITGRRFDDIRTTLMARYMLNHQNSDGGWGLHIEGPSTMFGTVLQYVALRLIGKNPGEESLKSARTWIHTNGGARLIPSWGKFYLALLGLYEWQGCNPLLPELWLMPKALPIHPSRYWCHSRMVFLPMSYCYGHRITTEKSDLLLAIRSEIYVEDYHSIDWVENRHNIANTDDFWPVSNTLRRAHRLIGFYERFHSKKLRKRALDFALQYVSAEDEQTEFVDIGPVNQIINSLCCWHAYGPDSEQFQSHVDRWTDYLWLAEDGMKMNGYNGSQLWDTAFATQAILEDPKSGRLFTETLNKAYNYIDTTQVDVEVKQRERFFRHKSVGGWPFSTRDHGWPIADCTAEGLSAVLALHSQNWPQNGPAIDAKRLEAAVEVILSLQNTDGGWATYENYRGPSWLEVLNAAEVFGKIMIDFSWTECTSACVRALIEFQEIYPDHRNKVIEKAIKRGIDFIKSQQKEDGSWLGAWGVCFTYGAWFALEALGRYGETYDSSEAVRRGSDFLVSKQMQDGGWGESHLSCVNSEYTNHETSQIINTSWAILGLMAVDYPGDIVMDKGVELLMSRQMQNGDWPQEGISGVFNQNCMITYTSYRNVFPIWALGRYMKKRGIQGMTT